jgi:hypothetical protein
MINFKEWLRSHRSRDPFAREEVVGRPVDARGKTCDWCGSEGRGGKLYQYTFETDGGRSSALKGLFCCKGCFKAYNN